MKQLFIFVLFLFLLPNTALSFRINEVMHDPSTSQGSDYYNEWIELYNNNSYNINLSGWKICNSELLPGYINHTDLDIYLNTGFIIQPTSYVIITDGGTGSTSGTDVYDNFNVDKNSIAFHIDLKYMCSSSGLGNSGDLINLSNGAYEQIFDYTYLVNLGYAKGDGNSLQLINGTWHSAAPTPGYENAASQEPEKNKTSVDIELTARLSDMLYVGEEYSQLFDIKLINKADCSAKDNITVFYNVSKGSELIKQDIFSKEIGCSGYADTGSMIFNQSGNYTLCGAIISSTANDSNKLNDEDCKEVSAIDTSSLPCNVSISITTFKEIYWDNESIKFYNNLSNESFPYLIEYWIEDLFGNVIKERTNTSNTNQKSYSPEISEQDLVLMIKNNLHALCNDSELSDNYAEKIVIIKSASPEFSHSQKNSSLRIKEIYLGSDNKASFGQSINARIEIYKGDTSKSSISLWAEDSNKNRISKETSISIYQKYMKYILTLPVQLKPNCDYGYDDGRYFFVLEGLGQKDSKSIDIEGITKDLCEKTEIEKTKETTSGSFIYLITDAPSEISPEEEFSVQVSLKNEDDEEHKAALWSYVYRGSKCYCRSSEENKIELLIEPGKEEIVTLRNKVTGAEPGDYKLKVNIIKDSQKTVRQLTREIRVTGPSEASTQQSFQSSSEGKETSLEAKKYPKTVFYSTTEKTRNLIPAFTITLFAILSAVLIWKKLS